MSLLFDAPVLPGLKYAEGVIGKGEERELIDRLVGLDLAPFAERPVHQGFAADLEQVESHQLGRRLLRQLLHAAFGRVESQLERLE